MITLKLLYHFNCDTRDYHYRVLRNRICNEVSKTWTEFSRPEANSQGSANFRCKILQSQDKFCFNENLAEKSRKLWQCTLILNTISSAISIPAQETTTTECKLNLTTTLLKSRVSMILFHSYRITTLVFQFNLSFVSCHLQHQRRLQQVVSLTWILVKWLCLYRHNLNVIFLRISILRSRNDNYRW